MFDMYEIEEIILGMADIVKENRRLRYELKEAKEYEKRYHNLLNECVDHANKSSGIMLQAIMAGAFSKGEEQGK